MLRFCRFSAVNKGDFFYEFFAKSGLQNFPENNLRRFAVFALASAQTFEFRRRNKRLGEVYKRQRTQKRSARRRSDYFEIGNGPAFHRRLRRTGDFSCRIRQGFAQSHDRRGGRGA